MPQFLQEPDLRIVGKKHFKLQTQLVYESDLLPRYSSHVIIVPVGFITDLASIPRIFRSIIPVNGKHRLAAIVHDYLCRMEGFDRKLADKIFLEAMKLLGVRLTRRYAMYYAVALATLFIGRKK